MPELVEQMYCSQQIVIPPKYPYILKRYCKAAIKTQPYDLLRWSFEYFKALAQRRPPPVKLRLEYPVYSTEGGLTRGCLKAIAQQLLGSRDIPLLTLKAKWQGFCLDQCELRRITCLCEAYMRSETVPFLHFIAVAAGLLTKSLTHTMILLCETLTKEPDGGSAAIPVNDFLTMYLFLAYMDASKDVKYFNGVREGAELPIEEEILEEEEQNIEVMDSDVASDDYWKDETDLQKLLLLNDNVARSARLSVKLNMPILGKIERSPSVERDGQIEMENHLADRSGRPAQCEDLEKKLRQLSTERVVPTEGKEETKKSTEEVKEDLNQGVEIEIYDEGDQPLPLDFYGEPKEKPPHKDVAEQCDEEEPETVEVDNVEVEEKATEAEKADLFVAEVNNNLSERSNKYSQKNDDLIGISKEREDRFQDLFDTFEEIEAIVERYQAATYDLGMVAGRQMSTTSGEFVVSHIEKEIMEYINEQIAILPDPDLKKKKAKPEEVAMVRDILETFLTENMDIIVPEIEEVEEEEQPIPDITVVYAVPGIGPPVDDDTVNDVVHYARDVCKVQADMFMPRNIRHFLCPPLEKFVEYKYDPEPQKKKEEVPTGGMFAQ